MLGLWHKTLSWSVGSARPKFPEGARTAAEYRARCEREILDGADEEDVLRKLSQEVYEQQQAGEDFDTLFGDTTEEPDDADTVSLWDLECDDASELSVEFAQLIKSQPMWKWGVKKREEWSRLPIGHKAKTVQELSLSPLPSLSQRNRSSAYRVKGHAPKPEDPVNLNQALEKKLKHDLSQQLNIFFKTEVSLWPGGSGSRLTDVASSDWDFYFDVPGVVVDEGQRDGLLAHLQRALNCTAKLSERSIAIQLQIGSTLIELVPRSSTYFDFDHVEFPRFFGSNNRTKIDEDLQLFLRGGAGARRAIREMKQAFQGNLPMLPSFLLEHLVKRVAMTFVIFDPWCGFTTEIKVPEAFEVICRTFEELAVLTQAGSDPFSPVQDLLQDLQLAETDRRQEILEALGHMAELTANPVWSVHLEHLLNPERFGCKCFLADPRQLPPPRSDYSLFLEHEVGEQKHKRFVQLLTMQPADDVDGLSVRLEIFELSMEYWEASMTWWNMSGCQRGPWTAKHREQVKTYKEVARCLQARKVTDPLQDSVVRLQPISELRRMACDAQILQREPWQVIFAVFETGLPATLKSLVRWWISNVRGCRLDRFLNSPFARHRAGQGHQKPLITSKVSGVFPGSSERRRKVGMSSLYPQPFRVPTTSYLLLDCLDLRAPNLLLGCLDRWAPVVKVCQARKGVEPQP